ncbi:hypothetical protein [Archangium lipolyticum]|uniref:hypothetical protein n=1 Tax=Archangium lipolyticum TaxID=2970465 RepID=UPI00214A757B|nr:hypothetical protein [Archangium lipolyticum]
MRKTDKKKTFIDYELPTKALEQVRGGRERVTTLAEGEETGSVTTQAVGEEGGCGRFTTEAVGEESGSY